MLKQTEQRMLLNMPHMHVRLMYIISFEEFMPTYRNY